MRDSRRQRGFVLIDERERRAGYHIADSERGSDPLGQSGLTGTEITVEQHDITILETTG
jgi:hypothetical protein